MSRPSLDLFRLDGRLAIVAGAAGLLGPSFSEALLEAGARVVALDVDQVRLEADARALRSRFGDAYATRRCDLTDEAEVHAIVEEIARRETPAILINAAAINPKPEGDDATQIVHGFTDYPAAFWRKSMEVNLTGMFLITRAVCRWLESAKRGVVVNVSSTYGLVGPDQRIYREGQAPPHFVKPGDYSTSKAGVLGFTRYLAAYYAGTNIRVNCLTPGGVFNNHDAAFASAYAARTPLRRMADRDDYKGAIVFLSSDASAYMTGSNLVVDGGWTAV